MGKGLGPAFPDREKRLREVTSSPHKGWSNSTRPEETYAPHLTPPCRVRIPPGLWREGESAGPRTWGARERDAALGPKRGRGEGSVARDRATTECSAKLVKAGEGRHARRQVRGGRGDPGAPPMPQSGAPASPPPHSAAPAKRHCSCTCALQPAMWQPGKGGKGPGAAIDGAPRPSGPNGRSALGDAGILGAGVGASLRAQGPDVAEVRRRGARVRGGGGPTPPARSLTSAMAVCAREAVAAPGSPDTEPRAHWLRRLGRRGLARAGPVRAGRGRGVVGARTGLRGMCAGAGRAREARVWGLGLGCGLGVGRGRRC